MIRYFGAGKQRVLAGAPLRFLAIIETPIQQIAASAVQPHISIDGGESIRYPLQHLGTVDAEPGVVENVYGLEITLDSGEYEISLQLNDEDTIALQENIWVLDQFHFGKLIEEEIEITGIDRYDLSLSRIGQRSPLPQPAIDHIVKCIFAERLSGFLCLDGRIVSEPPLHVRFEGAVSLAGDPASYVAAVFADQCRDLLFFGADTASISVTFSEYNYKLSFVANLNEQVSDSFAMFYESDATNELSLVAKALESLIPRTNISAATAISGASVSMSLALEQQQAAVAF